MFLFSQGTRHLFLDMWRVFFLIVVFFSFRSSGARPENVPVKVVPVEMTGGFDVTPVVFDSEVSYYRPIIEQNLFRPLSWVPPRPIEPYRLIGEPDTGFQRCRHTPESHHCDDHRKQNPHRNHR